MKTNKKIALFLAATVLISLLAGCLEPQTTFPSYSKREENSSVVKRFEGTPQKDTTTIESAIKLSERYAKLSEQTTVLLQKNQDLNTKNKQLKNRLAALEAELKQTKKELTEANDLLIEMRIELNNWKTDILGYRNEMRDADKAQLEALLKILEVLGGEVQAKEPQEQDQAQTAALSDEQSKVQLKEAPISGEPNE